MTAPVIEASGLVKTFGDVVAVDDVSFEVPRGTVFGLLGPNGAGKTTTVRMMTTLATPTRGTATVAGHDVVREPFGVDRAVRSIDPEMVYHPPISSGSAPTYRASAARSSTTQCPASNSSKAASAAIPTQS